MLPNPEVTRPPFELRHGVKLGDGGCDNAALLLDHIARLEVRKKRAV